MFYDQLEEWLRGDVRRIATIKWAAVSQKWLVRLETSEPGAVRTQAYTTSPRIAWAIMDALEAMQPKVSA